MIPESLSNRVYFSALLPEVCPVTYNGLVNILDRYGVPHSLLDGTKDIWCRDYMPIQTIDNRFVLFRYEPDYLLDTARHKASITDNSVAGRYVGTSYMEDSRGIKIDGGNVVHNGCKVIMTAKVFEENPQWMSRDLIEHLTRTFGADIIFLPWDTHEIYGHTDGIVRFIDEDTVLMTNYAQFDPDMAARFRRILKAHFKNVHELSFKPTKPHKYSWAYINWLQTDKVLILPKFNIPEDQEAYDQISKLMPHYKGRIEMVDATDLIRYEGGLNCASWTLYDTPNRDLP
ncbi:MAG: agmatine deiminase family protein [Bacteroidales bacterium]|nr:agmatine deiminase family protein [Candidatus Cacconaster merdequi]